MKHLDIMEKAGVSDVGVKNEKIRDILNYIQEHYRETLQIEKLASSRGISSRFLRRYFKEEIGMPCLERKSDLMKRKMITDSPRPGISGWSNPVWKTMTARSIRIVLEFEGKCAGWDACLTGNQ